MRTLLLVIFSVFLISSVALVSSVQDSFADEVIGTSIGFEDSTILELKNSRGNTATIDSIRIWLSGDNEFKSFKTEQGWLGKKQLNGVIEFTSQQQVKPGEYVKFGIKTIEENPTINWKAVKLITFLIVIQIYLCMDGMSSLVQGNPKRGQCRRTTPSHQHESKIAPSPPPPHTVWGRREGAILLSHAW